MSDLPENLQIKRELSSPSTSEDNSLNNIKAKLNQHVKRRLQDFNQTSQENSAHINSRTQGVTDVIKQERPKTETKQKRSYHKRADKNKSNTQSLDNKLISSISNEASSTSQRKYKHKIKQITTDSLDQFGSISTEENASSQYNTTITADAISAGDEDDGANDNDLKTGREKEKCPDVLGMVLSMKKRTLMQDPEVQSFLKEVMEVIKS